MIRSSTSPAAAPTVLVVEDEVIIQMLLTEALQDEGLHVLEANSADAAVQAFATGAPIQVVVTDVRMPGSMDGLGLACWMRENAPAVPIIITSGLVAGADSAACTPLIVRIFPKPYNPSEVASCVRTLIGALPVPENEIRA